jgi:4'-phosphopantetheinyl transferase
VTSSLVRVLPRGSAEADRARLVESAAALLDVEPATLALRRHCDHCGGDDHGRPSVAGPGHPPIWASLSRAGELVAVAVSTAGPVGVDIESLDRVAAAGFDDVAFSAAERESITGDHDRARLWTAKEAVLKARGTGLRVDPRTVDVANPAGGIRLQQIDVPDGYAATVAYGTISSGTGTE